MNSPKKSSIDHIDFNNNRTLQLLKLVEAIEVQVLRPKKPAPAIPGDEKQTWMILQQEQPEDYVLATGESTSVREFCEMAFAHLGIQLRWEGEGPNEKGFIDSINEEKFKTSTSQQLNAEQKRSNNRSGPEVFSSHGSRNITGRSFPSQRNVRMEAEICYQ